MLSLQKIADAGRQVRQATLESGLPLPGKARVRLRTPEKEAFLNRIGETRLKQYPPSTKMVNGQRVLVLPYISR